MIIMKSMRKKRRGSMINVKMNSCLLVNIDQRKMPRLKLLRKRLRRDRRGRRNLEIR